MAGIIRVTPEELRTVSKQYSTESANVTEMLVRLDGMIDRLQAIWEGSSSEAFSGQYTELRPSFEKMSTLLADVAKQLHDSADILEQTDEQIASQIRG